MSKQTENHDQPIFCNYRKFRPCFPDTFLSVVSLQLGQVGGEGGVWLPPNCTGLDIVKIINRALVNSCSSCFTSNRFLLSNLPKYFSKIGIIEAPGNLSCSYNFLKYFKPSQEVTFKLSPYLNPNIGAHV